MSTDSDQRFSVDTVEERRLRTVVKLLLIAAGLVILWSRFTALPGLDRLVPSTPFTYSAVAGAIVSLGLVVVLAYVGTRVEPMLRTSVRGQVQIVDDAAASVKYFLWFVAAIVAYEGFGALVEPTLAVVDLVWVYDALFLLLASIPMALIAVRMYRNLDAVTDLVVDHLTAEDDESETDPTEST
ncbi:MAG: hypothetical protein ABEJ57_04270 [Halobacteriaceae archaeon]